MSVIQLSNSIPSIYILIDFRNGCAIDRLLLSARLGLWQTNFFSLQMRNTNLHIRFIKIRNGSRHFCIRFSPKRISKSVSQKTETKLETRFSFFFDRNECQNSFQTFAKRISTSVSCFFFKFAFIFINL